DGGVPADGGEVFGKGAGRALQRIRGRMSVSFVQRDSVAGAALEELDIRRRRVTELTKVPAGADFFAWTPDGIVLTASGTTLYQWDSRRGGAWERVADLAAAGLSNVTRLATSPQGDRLAIVAVPVAR